MTGDPFGIAGRAALVTGASAGLGRHLALTLARAGAPVALAARRLDRLEALAAEIVAAGGTARAVALDVTDPASVAAGIAAAEAALGPIEILVNNAGVAATLPFLEQGEAEWRRVLDVDLDGAWRVGRAVAAAMARHGRGGSIVNIASVAGLHPVGRLSAYAAAKAALISLTKSMAIELARHQIRVNALAPGYIETDMNRDFLRSEAGQTMMRRVPLRRWGDPADLDGPLLLLVSPAGRHMTGAVLVIDGGHSLSNV